jgi:co-chaperonin GroES (HSP10)
MNMKKNGEMDLVMGGNAHSMIVDTKGNKAAEKAAIKYHNKVINDYTKALNSKTNTELEEAQKITEKMKSMEIVPINNYVLVKPYAKNPFEKIEVTDSGLVIPTYDGKFKNPDSGEEDTEVNLSVQA